jgi:hypothetical protein
VLLVLALLLTYPLPLHLATRAPGDGSDDPAIIWNLWWVRHALLDLGRNPFSTDYMFFPIGINLAFYTLTTLNALITLPVQLLWGLIPANSAVVYFELTLSGLGMYLLAVDLLPASVPDARRHHSALIAAFVYAFAEHKFVFLSLGQFNIASTHWLPFYVLYLRRALRSPFRQRDALLAALFLLFNGWTEFTYASFALVFTAFYVLFRLIQVASEPNRERVWAACLAITQPLLRIAVLFLLGMSPILAMMIPDLLREGDFTVVGLGFADVFSNDLLEFFVPGHLHPLWGSLSRHFSFAYLNFGYLGYTALLLAGIGLWRWRRRAETRFWALAAAAFIAISFGPTIRLNGTSYDLPLPFDLLLTLPFFKANRYPSRYSVMIALCLAVLAAYGVAALTASRTFRHAPFALAVFILIENLSIPLPLSDYHVPPVYKQIAAEPGDSTVLEIPLAWRNGFRVTGPLNNAFMFAQFYQTTHEKRMISGNTSRNPEFKFQYFTEAPVINSLIALETGHKLPPGQPDQDRSVAADVLRFFRVRYIIVDKLRPAGRRVTPEATIPYIERVLPVRRWFDGQQRVIYRVPQGAASRAGQVGARGPLANLVFAEGWGPASASSVRWATRRDVRMFLPLGPSAYTLTLGLESPALAQTLSVRVGGRLVARLDLARGRNTYTVTVPADAARQPPTEVQLHFTRLFPPPTSNTGWPIGATSSSSPVPLLVESAGEEVGNLAHVYLNGRDQALGGRGFNLVVIDPADGTVAARATFDTHLDPAASARLARFIAGIPEGSIVAVAVADEGSRLLGDDAVQALHTVGMSVSLRGKEHFRWSYAALGVKGAAPGTALEAAAGIRPTRVAVGPAIREPHVAAALFRVAWEER